MQAYRLTNTFRLECGPLHGKRSVGRHTGLRRRNQGSENALKPGRLLDRGWITGREMPRHAGQRLNDYPEHQQHAKERSHESKTS